MKKRILAALVVLCLAACLAPLSAFATLEPSVGEKTKITQLTITVDTPVVGMTTPLRITDNHFKAIAVTAKGSIENAVTVSSANGNNVLEYFRCNASSYKGDGKDVWQDVGYAHDIIPKSYYRIRAILTPADGYEFAENITCTVNGVTCAATYENIYQGSDKVVVHHTFDPVHYDNTDGKYTIVTDLTATITEPKIGVIPSIDAKISTTPADTATCYGVEWDKMSVADYEKLKNWNIDPHADTETPPEWKIMSYTSDYTSFAYTEEFQSGYVYRAVLSFETQPWESKPGETTRVFDENITATNKRRQMQQRIYGQPRGGFQPLCSGILH